MMFKKILVCAAILIFGTSAFAQDQDDGSRVGVTLKLGKAKFSGDLSNESDESVYALQVKVAPSGPFAESWRNSNAFKKAMGGFEIRSMIEFENTQTTQEGDFALVPPDEKVELQTLGIYAELCVLANYPVQLCPYLGFGTVQATDKKEHGDRYSTSAAMFPYGAVISSNIAINADYELLLGAQLGMYDVKQTVNEDKQSFKVTTTAIYLGLGF